MTSAPLVCVLALALGGCSCSAGRAPGAAAGGGSPGPGAGSGGTPAVPPSATAPAAPGMAPSGPSVPATSSPELDPAPVPGRDRKHPPDPDLDWTGWTLHPALPQGCRGMYVPDDVKKREKPLTWQPCPASMAMSCQELVRNWTNDVSAFPGTGVVLVGGGTQPEALVLFYWLSKSKVLEDVLYDGAGQPIAALREDTYDDGPNASFVPGVSSDGKYLDLELSWPVCAPERPEELLVVPADQPSQLMYSSQSTLTWSGSIGAHQEVQDVVRVDDQIATAMLVGAAAAGDLSTGKSVMITPPPGSGADWDPWIVRGRTTFLARGVQGEVSIWISRDLGMATPFIHPPGDAVSFATDGKTMLWQVSSDPLDPVQGVYARHDVYAAPYTTDPIKLQATKQWMGELPTTWACVGMNNGYAYGSDCAGSGVHRAFVMRVSDGKWWEVEAPPLSMFFASPTELWMVTGDSNGKTILRVPYGELAPRDFTQGGPP